MGKQSNNFEPSKYNSVFSSFDEKVNFCGKSQRTHVFFFQDKMDAANMSGTFMVSTSRRMSNVSSSGSTGSGSSSSGSSYGSYGASPSSTGSYIAAGMSNMFKKKEDVNDTMSGGLSKVHKYMSPF